MLTVVPSMPCLEQLPVVVDPWSYPLCPVYGSKSLIFIRCSLATRVKYVSEVNPTSLAACRAILDKIVGNFNSNNV
jgi:hypothetical protein